MGDPGAGAPDHAADVAGLRLRAALTERRRADAAIRGAIRTIIDIVASDRAPVDTNTEARGTPLANTIAHAVPDLTADDIALAVATKDHQQGTSSPAPERPGRPSMPPMVFLRGVGINTRTFDRVHVALWARGLHTITDRTSAMHLSRGGVHVWMVDFSAAGEAKTGAPVSIARMCAVYEATPGGQQLQFKRVASSQVNRPVCEGELDVDMLADLVAAEAIMKSAQQPR